MGHKLGKSGFIGSRLIICIILILQYQCKHNLILMWTCLKSSTTQTSTWMQSAYQNLTESHEESRLGEDSRVHNLHGNAQKSAQKWLKSWAVWQEAQTGSRNLTVAFNFRWSLTRKLRECTASLDIFSPYFFSPGHHCSIRSSRELNLTKVEKNCLCLVQGGLWISWN